MGRGTFSRSINDTNQSCKAHWNGDSRIETGGHLFKEEMELRLTFGFVSFIEFCTGYVSSAALAVSPALHMFSNRRFHNPVRAWFVT